MIRCLLFLTVCMEWERWLLIVGNCTTCWYDSSTRLTHIRQFQKSNFGNFRPSLNGIQIEVSYIELHTDRSCFYGMLFFYSPMIFSSWVLSCRFGWPAHMDHLTCPTENSIPTSGIPKLPGNDSTFSLSKTLWKSHPKRGDTRSVNFLVGRW